MNLLIFTFLCVTFTSQLNANPLTPIVFTGKYNEVYNIVVNDTVEYIYQYENSLNHEPSRITVTSTDASASFPILVVVRQQKEVLSWQIPLLVDSENGDITFDKTSRTLCPTNINYIRKMPATIPAVVQAAPIVSLSTASPENITVSFVVEHEVDFYLHERQKYKAVITPSEPKYFFYKFEKSDNTSDHLKTVLLEVYSDDEVCTLISIQNSSCPVFDLEHNIKFEGIYETINRKGGITITESQFPDGFFLVFVAKGDDLDCTGKTNPDSKNRTKIIEFIIKPSISYNEYWTAVAITLGVVAAFYIVFWGLLCMCSRRGFLPMTMQYVDASVDVFHSELPTPSTVTAEMLADDPAFDYNSSMDETDYDTIAEALSERDIYRSKSVVFLSDLARKDPRILKKKSYLYLWHVLTVAVFYGLPVVQLVVTYQYVLNNTGNQDLCYYNFLCAHPLGSVSDFNHLFSNIGYVLLGLLFVLLVYRRERMHTDREFDRSFGIPQHYGMFYAMGVALIMEGVLSGSYHVCPNHSNFQFDSSFMYVVAVLCMVKIYQNRHPDINATAYSTFGVLAVAIFLGMVGILDGSVWFWSIFTVIHLTVCLVLTIQVYYMGRMKLDRTIFKHFATAFVLNYRSGVLNLLTPTYKARMLLLLVVNACNWTLAVLGLYYHNRDFATYLLGIFLINTFSYFVFYIVMKLCHKEKIVLHALMFIILAFTAGGAAMYFFIHKSISWQLHPAESRFYNQNCRLLRFYDRHDIWHFLSAAGMFFIFMALLTLDDDLSHTHRLKIRVF